MNPGRRGLLNWIERHPKSMLWLLAVSTANFALSVLEAVTR